MANETFPLSKPIEVLNPVSNLDYDYGPYNTVAEALSALAEIGLVGRPFAVFKDETKKTVDFFLIGEDGNGNKIAVPTEGGAKFPEVGNDGDILEKDGATAEGAKWSNRLTTAENEIDAEVVNRAAEDLAEKNARIAGDNYLLDQLATESTNRANADISEANARTAADGLLDTKITAEKNRNDTQDISIADLNSGLANRVQLTTTNITAPDATYFYVYMLSAGNVPRRMNLDTYLNSKGYLTSTSISNKLDKVNTAPQTVASNVTFNGKIIYNPAVSPIINYVMTYNAANELGKSEVVEILADDGAVTKYSSEAALDAAFPLVVSGFELICPNITTTNFPSGVVYKKTSVGWRAEKLYLITDV